MAWRRGPFCLLLVALTGAFSCSRASEHAAPGAGGSAAGEPAETSAGETSAMGGGAGEPGMAGAGAGYDPNGPCTPGVPRCHGDFGYQSCEQDGTWGATHSCAGYSLNGTSSYCVDVPSEDGSRWGTCVDPACWFWMTRGFVPGETPVGICLPDGALRRCSDGGTLTSEACAAGCTQVASLDGRALGFCGIACSSGARECLGGALYRECQEGRWQSDVLSCAEGKACNPVATGATPDIRCGGDCDPGTSRCAADRSAVEACNEAGQFELDRPCALGLCLPAGPQAECQAQCSEGQRLCGWDGAASERVCQSSGLWGPEAPCESGSTCRISGSHGLGCVACVGPGNASGNTFGVADSRCEADGLGRCGEDDTWQPAQACEHGEACSQVDDGASSVAACALAGD